MAKAADKPSAQASTGAIDAPAAAANKGGRPPKLQADAKTLVQIRGLALIHCTQEEAALVMGVTVPTFRKFFADNPEALQQWDEGRAEGKASLRRDQWAMAKKNPAMAIWLGKQYLGQRDLKEIAIDAPAAGADMPANATARDRLGHLIRRQQSALAGGPGSGPSKPH